MRTPLSSLLKITGSKEDPIKSMPEERQEQEVGSNDFENEETSEETSEETGSSEKPDLEKKIKELEGQKNYYQEQYKKLKEKGGKEENEEPKYLTREEAKFIAQGMSDEDLDQLNAVSQGKGISLSEAQEDPLFKAYQASKEQESKSEKGQIGPSTGSPQPGGTASTREEHMKQFNELRKQYGE